MNRILWKCEQQTVKLKLLLSVVEISLFALPRVP